VLSAVPGTRCRRFLEGEYEDVYLKAYSSIADVRQGLKVYFERHNSRRRHQGFGDRTPGEVYLTTLPEAREAV